jgi:hypothetical protein
VREVSLLTCGSSIPTVVFRVISDFWEHPHPRGDPISALDDLEAHLAKLPRVSLSRARPDRPSARRPGQYLDPVSPGSLIAAIATLA